MFFLKKKFFNYNLYYKILATREQKNFDSSASDNFAFENKFVSEKLETKK